jgi:hypothetical protein
MDKQLIETKLIRALNIAGAFAVSVELPGNPGFPYVLVLKNEKAFLFELQYVENMDTMPDHALVDNYRAPGLRESQYPAIRRILQDFNNVDIVYSDGNKYAFLTSLNISVADRPKIKGCFSHHLSLGEFVADIIEGLYESE